MSDISRSEARLIAALDRIDRSLDAATARPDQGADDLQAARDDNARLTAALADRPAAAPDAIDLAAANEALMAANRALIEAADGRGDSDAAARAAVEAEVQALHAVRATEVARMSGILSTIEAALADAPPPAEEDR